MKLPFERGRSIWVKNLRFSDRGDKPGIVGAIPFCGEHPSPRFEDNF